MMVGNCTYRWPWDGHSDSIGYYSKRNEIVFSALQHIINEQVANCFIAQGRCIKDELLEIVRIFIYIDI